jgi:hypothetical protein
MRQDTKTLDQRTAQAGRRTTPAGVGGTLPSVAIYPGLIISADAGGVYTVAVVLPDGTPSTDQIPGVAPLLPGGQFAVNDPVALMFQQGEQVPVILATVGGLDPDGAVYIITGLTGWTG